MGFLRPLSASLLPLLLINLNFNFALNHPLWLTHTEFIHHISTITFLPTTPPWISNIIFQQQPPQFVNNQPSSSVRRRRRFRRRGTTNQSTHVHLYWKPDCRQLRQQNWRKSWGARYMLWDDRSWASRRNIGRMSSGAAMLGLKNASTGLVTLKCSNSSRVIPWK